MLSLFHLRGLADVYHNSRGGFGRGRGDAPSS